MAHHRVRVFRSAQPPVAPPGPTPAYPAPVEEPGFTVDAFTHDEARRAVQERLASFGEVTKSLSHGVDGALVAVLYPRPAPPR